MIQSAVDKPNCATCFEAVGATPIDKQTYLVIVTESVFTKPEFDSHWTPDKEVAEGMRKRFNDTKHGFLSQTTAADVSNAGPYNGKRYIGITNSGMNEQLDHFSVTLIHALLHSGGKEAGSIGVSHDLIYLGKQYDDVIEACQDNKSNMRKAADILEEANNE